MNRSEKILPVVLLGILWVNFAYGGSARDAWIQLIGEKLENRPEFAYVENNPSLPNVLIYGDSISIAYTQRVREDLKDKANVYRLYCNGGDSASFIEKMTTMHDTMRDKNLDHPWKFQWDVIQFNIGLHDLKFVANRKLDKKDGKQVSSIDEYKKNLVDIVAYMRKLSPGAKLIFATTTPVPEGEPGRFAGDARKYNAAALEVMRKYPDITINDLYAFTKPYHSKWWSKPGNVHYNDDGKNAQGDEVARIILETLSRKDKSHNVFTMPNHSMAPTIEKGEIVKADMKAYEIADPKLGDLVIFIPNENRELRWVFRVAAVPGDALSYRNGVLERNGAAIHAPAPLQDHFFKSPNRMKEGSEIIFPYALKGDEYFLLSDDPSHMHDSRYWGFVGRDQILGKLLIK